MDTKKWYLSKTLWAGLITLIVGVLTAFKVIHIGPVLVENIAAEQEGISQVIVGLFEIVAGAVVLWGRLTAKTELTG